MIETASNTASTLNHVTIGAGVTVTVVDDSTLKLTGNITNDGTIALDSSGDITTLVIGANVTLTGGGALTLSDVPPAVLGGITNDIVASGATAASPFTLTNTNHMISGAASIGDGDQTLTLKTMLITAITMIAVSTPAFAQAQYVPSTCAHGYYQNADGVCVHKPTAVPHEGATALCRDGLYSYATRGPDICANHGGIVRLLQ